MEKKFLIGSIDELGTVVDYLAQLTSSLKFFTLDGELGTGKTTLVQMICEKMGVKDNVSSPTFSIVNEYRLNDKSIYHFDLYRIKDQEELLNIGVEEYFMSNDFCFVEWPAIGVPFFPDKYVSIQIKRTGENREFIISFPD